MAHHLPPGLWPSSDPRGLQKLQGPLAMSLCSSGWLVDATPRALDLLGNIGLIVKELPARIPPELWDQILSMPSGEATVWAPPPPKHHEASVGVSAYSLGGGAVLVLMQEVSDKHRTLSRQLHLDRVTMMGRLMAMIAHDVRSPLATILLNAEALRRRSTDLETLGLTENVSHLVAAANRIDTMIANLLQFVQAGAPVLAPVRTQRLLRRVTRAFRPLFRGQRRILEHRVAQDAQWIRTSAFFAEQILSNLVSNAAEKSTEALRVCVSASAQEGSSLATGRVRIRVQDDGPAIATKTRPRVFEPLFTTKKDGAGLGLTTARETARQLGGDLLLDEQCEIGFSTGFSLYLPAASAGTATEEIR